VYRKGQLNTIADALSGREDFRPGDSVLILENEEILDTTRNTYADDPLFRDIAAFF